MILLSQADGSFLSVIQKMKLDAEPPSNQYISSYRKPLTPLPNGNEYVASRMSDHVSMRVQ